MISDDIDQNDIAHNRILEDNSQNHIKMQVQLSLPAHSLLFWSSFKSL